MSNHFGNAPTLSDAELVNLYESSNDLLEQQKLLQKQLANINALIQIAKLVTNVHLGVPVNVHESKSNYYNSCTISNVTPTEEQRKTERQAEYLLNKKVKIVQLNLRLGVPQIATTSITCPNAEIAKEIAMDFVATGKFPLLNKLICQFKDKQKD